MSKYDECIQEGFPSNEDVINDFKRCIESGNYYFEEWNTTNIQHLLIFMTHYNSDCKAISCVMFTKFLSWYIENESNGYVPKCGLESMYSKKCMQNLLTIINDNSDTSIEDIDKMIAIEIKKTGNITSIFKEKHNKSHIYGWALVYFGIGLMGYGIRRLFIDN
jgi:hypothetical protein